MTGNHMPSTFYPKGLLRRIVMIEDQDVQPRDTPQKKHRHRGRSKHLNKDTAHSDAGDHKWAFVPARVLDGISLRKLGIQVVSFYVLGCFYTTLANNCSMS